MVGESTSETIEVDVVTVEETLAGLGVRQEAVGLAWIDAEGFEAQVLARWPSLGGTPTMLECQPNLIGLPVHFLSACRRWAQVGDGELAWHSTDEFRPADFEETTDLLFA